MPGQIYIYADLAIVKQALQRRLEDAGIGGQSPDLLIIPEGTKLNVDVSKQIQEFLGLKPYALPIKAVVIEDVTGVSEVVQNSLLKTLEELRPDRIMLLGAIHTQALLPTLLSRVEIHQLAAETKQQLSPKQEAKLNQLLEMDLVERFKTIEKIKDKAEVVEELMHYFQPRLHHDHRLVETGELLLTAERWLKSNVNARAILEYLMIRLPKNS